MHGHLHIQTLAFELNAAHLMAPLPSQYTNLDTQQKNQSLKRSNPLDLLTADNKVTIENKITDVNTSARNTS